MKKLFKSRKALSPVVAAIILIAVTVAVSIAVAAWMGALTFTFMKTEELKVTGISWGTGNANATLAVKNSGTGSLTISSAKANDVAITLYKYKKPSGTGTLTDWPTAGLTLEPGDTADITVKLSSGNFVSGTKYEIAFYCATGNRYPYTSTAP